LGISRWQWDDFESWPAPGVRHRRPVGETVAGYTIGGGAAFAAFSSREIWADYRFTDYETASGDIANCCAPPPNSQDHDLTTHAVRVGVSRGFGTASP